MRILVIEDDKLAQTVMASHLAAHDTAFADSKPEAEKLLKKGVYNICFVDLKLGKDDDFSGLSLLPVIKKRGIYAVVMSSSDDEETVNKAYALGCDDFYVKGNEAENVAALLGKYRRNGNLQDPDSIFSSAFITTDPATRAVVCEALKYAPTSIPLLLLGPSGTGKTCLAKILHGHSGREGAFVAINCSAYTEELLEAELFGYKKGAFTGAYDNRRGKLAQAHRGTLFLDEIGDMSHTMQTKLLKAIEERTFYPVGSDKPEHSEFRIISATLEDLQKLVSEGKLRFDFFQRIHGYTVNLKPLAQRPGDIFPLIRELTKARKRLSFAPDAREFLLAYAWPGNIRELKKFLELLTATEGQITLKTAKHHIAQAIHSGQRDNGPLVTERQYDCALEHGLAEAQNRFAWDVLKRNLKENNGVKAQTLGQLKISSKVLFDLLKKYGE